MAPSVLITGNSSGLGHGLTLEFLARGYQVYGLSRRGWPGKRDSGLHEVLCDLARSTRIVPSLESLLGKKKRLDVVVLNAGVLAEIRDISDTPLEDIQKVMDINVWANKIVLDWLHDRDLKIKQIVTISSGAAVDAKRGWGAYSLSKSALNMLTKLYVPEFPQTHLCALAPGLVDTAMQEYLCDPDAVDAQRFPSLQKLRDARGTERMPTPREAARRLVKLLPKLKDYPSGGFADVRTMKSAP